MPTDQELALLALFTVTLTVGVYRFCAAMADLWDELSRRRAAEQYKETAR